MLQVVIAGSQLEAEEVVEGTVEVEVALVEVAVAAGSVVAAETVAETDQASWRWGHCCLAGYGDATSASQNDSASTSTVSNGFASAGSRPAPLPLMSQPAVPPPQLQALGASFPPQGVDFGQPPPSLQSAQQNGGYVGGSHFSVPPPMVQVAAGRALMGNKLMAQPPPGPPPIFLHNLASQPPPPPPPPEEPCPPQSMSAFSYRHSIPQR